MTDKTEEQKKDLVVFLDTIGRTIIAERINENDDLLTVENPAVVNIVPQQVPGPNGQQTQRMALQLFPLFFREFLAAKEEPVRFKYNKANITMSEGDIALDFKVGIQYEQLFTNTGEIVQQPQPENAPTQQAQQTQPDNTPDNIIQLFDE